MKIHMVNLNKPIFFLMKSLKQACAFQSLGDSWKCVASWRQWYGILKPKHAFVGKNRNLKPEEILGNYWILSFLYSCRKFCSWKFSVGIFSVHCKTSLFKHRKACLTLTLPEKIIKSKYLNITSKYLLIFNHEYNGYIRNINKYV